MKRMYVVAALAIVVTGIAGCGKEAPPPPPPAPKVEAPAPAPAPVGVSVLNINLGKAIGSDNKVTAPAETFAKTDTIYAVVETTGAGNATLKAKWTYHKGDQTAVVDESMQTIAATGPATNEFHISKPDGWPSGEYQVEVTLDDKPAGTKKFSVN